MKKVLSPSSETMMTDSAAKNPCKNRSSDMDEPRQYIYTEQDTDILKRAGHATTLPRQRVHVFRPLNCWFLHYVFRYLLHGYETFSYFFGSLKLYYFVALSRSWTIVACPAVIQPAQRWHSALSAKNIVRSGGVNVTVLYKTQTSQWIVPNLKSIMHVQSLFFPIGNNAFQVSTM